MLMLYWRIDSATHPYQGPSAVILARYSMEASLLTVFVKGMNSSNNSNSATTLFIHVSRLQKKQRHINGHEFM